MTMLTIIPPEDIIRNQPKVFSFFPLSIPLTGDGASQFEEAYSVDIDAKDRAASSSGVSGQTPHPPDMYYDKGNFSNTEFSLRLFSGLDYNNGKELKTGQQITSLAESLFKLSMPRISEEEDNFLGPPLMLMMYGQFWRAKGLLQKVRFISEGAFDRFGYPTIATLRFEFARHFGGRAFRQDNTSRYVRAEARDLRAATAQGFAFRG